MTDPPGGDEPPQSAIGKTVRLTPVDVLPRGFLLPRHQEAGEGMYLGIRTEGSGLVGSLLVLTTYEVIERADWFLLAGDAEAMPQSEGSPQWKRYAAVGWVAPACEGEYECRVWLQPVPVRQAGS